MQALERDGQVERTRCAQPGCGRPVVESWDERLCASCALERDLFDRDARYASWAAAGH